MYTPIKYRLRTISILLCILPLFLWGQESSFPKNTIYVKYVSKKEGNKKIMDWCYKDERGITFVIEDSSALYPGYNNKYISLFYPYAEVSDTISLEKIRDYRFSNLKEINQKRYKWIFNHNRPPMARNDVFQTYLVEVISQEKFVVYPVIWLNDGIDK